MSLAQQARLDYGDNYGDGAYGDYGDDGDDGDDCDYGNYGGDNYKMIISSFKTSPLIWKGICH